MEQLIEDAILAYWSEGGGIDWSCFAEGFGAMDAELPDRLWAWLMPGKGGTNGVYRFTVENHSLRGLLLSVGPGASNGDLTAIVHADTPGEIAIVERGGEDRWVAIKAQDK